MQEIVGDFLGLKVPEKDKTEKWYDFHKNRIILNEGNFKVPDYDEMIKLYEFSNNNLSRFQSEIDQYCGFLEGEAQEELIPYNPTNNKLDVLKGELSTRSNNHRIILLTAQAHYNRDQELLALINRSVEEELVLAVKKQQAMMDKMEPEKAQEYIESLRTELAPQDLDLKKFQSESEITYNKLLQFSMYDQQIPFKKLETGEDLWKVDRIFLYPGWKHGRPHIKVCNPLFIGFFKSPDEPYVQKSEYVFYKEEVTMADAMQELFSKNVDPKKIRDILDQSTSTTSRYDRRHITEPMLDSSANYQQVLAALGYNADDEVGTHMGQANNVPVFDSTVSRTHVEFKAYKEVIFFSYDDDYGVKQTVLINKNTDVIPERASKVEFENDFGELSTKYIWETNEVEYTAEILWVPRRYEMVVWDENLITDYREVPNQPANITNPYSKFELTYKGGILNSRNAKFISRLQRALPYIFQYMSAKRIIDDLLSTYVGQEKIVDVQQIPDDIDEESGIEEDRILRNEIIARKTKTRLYDSQRSNNAYGVNNTRTRGVEYQVVDTSPQLINMQNFCEVLNGEIGRIMGIPPQREAGQVSGTATDNRQALIQSSLSTQVDFLFIDQIWNSALNEHLFNMKTWLKKVLNGKKEHQLEYILPSGGKEVIKITPDSLEKLEDMGLYMTDSNKDKMYFDFMLNPQNLMAFAQNQGQGVEKMSSMLKAITSTNSVEEAHRQIAIAAKKEAEAAQAESRQQEELQKQAMELQKEMAIFTAELKLQGELTKIGTQSIANLKQADIQASIMERQADVNRNNENDSIEKERMKLNHESAENAKDREVEREKLKSQEKIASKKPKS